MWGQPGSMLYLHLLRVTFAFFVIIDPLFLLLKEVEYYFFETVSVIIQCATNIWLK